jgi:hypothetical protein
VAPQRRRPVANLGLTLAATLATLLACEGVARVFLWPPRYHREPVAFDPLLGFRGIPGYRQEVEDERGRAVFALNAQGFRGRELPSEPTPATGGMLRVLFVGDSFLVGSAVREEQLVTSLVESALRSQGRQAEVFNLSGADWGTAQELLALRALGRPLAPDAIVLFVYPANDLINNSMGLAGRTTVSPGDPIRPYLVREGGELRVRYLDPIRAFARRHSRLFALLERRVLASTSGGGGGWGEISARLQRGDAPREDLEIFRPRVDPGDRWEQAWAESLDLLRAFRDECEAMGARLLVVVVPSMHQVLVTPKSIRLDLEALAVRRLPLSAILDWDLPERRLAEFLGAERIDARLLLGPLREGARKGGVVYARDEHLAARGHEIAADAVIGWLLPAGAHATPATADLGEGPVPALPDAALAPAWLDFGKDRHLEFLGDGWNSWRPAGSGAAAGWLVGASALSVLPLRDGALSIRGFTPPAARLPILGRIQLVGGPGARFRIDRPGSFALRFFVEPQERQGWRSSRRFVAVLLASAGPAGARGESGLFWIEGLGFDAAQEEQVDEALPD